MDYEIVKWLHILSATLLFGTGLGSAFYKYMGDRSQDISTIAYTNKHVVLADWVFTTPTIVIQPITGLILVSIIGGSITDVWVILSIVFYTLAGLCWLPVVVLQIRMSKIAKAARLNNSELPDSYWRYANQWFWLGIPAFLSMMLVFLFMVLKPGA